MGKETKGGVCVVVCSCSNAQQSRNYKRALLIVTLVICALITSYIIRQATAVSLLFAQHRFSTEASSMSRFIKFHSDTMPMNNTGMFKFWWRKKREKIVSTNARL